MKRTQTLSGAELEVMQILWKSNKPLTVQCVCDRLPKGKWAYKTVGTLLIRMTEKGTVVCEKRGRANFYSPVLDKADYTKEQTKAFVSRLYNGSAKELAVSLFKSGGITEDDIAEIRKMFKL